MSIKGMIGYRLELYAQLDDCHVTNCANTQVFQVVTRKTRQLTPILPCKAKRQYLLTLQVSRFRLLALRTPILV